MHLALIDPNREARQLGCVPEGECAVTVIVALSRGAVVAGAQIDGGFFTAFISRNREVRGPNATRSYLVTPHMRIGVVHPHIDIRTSSGNTRHDTIDVIDSSKTRLHMRLRVARLVINDDRVTRRYHQPGRIEHIEMELAGVLGTSPNNRHISKHRTIDRDRDQITRRPLVTPQILHPHHKMRIRNVPIHLGAVTIDVRLVHPPVVPRSDVVAMVGRKVHTPTTAARVGCH